METNGKRGNPPWGRRLKLVLAALGVTAAIAGGAATATADDQSDERFELVGVIERVDLGEILRAVHFEQAPPADGDSTDDGSNDDGSNDDGSGGSTPSTVPDGQFRTSGVRW